jgi:hypothetical protein
MAFSDERYRECHVQTARLDTLVRNRELNPTLIKIDIEGAEQLALAGAAEKLAKHRPMLMVEVTCHADAVFQQLHALGYRLFTPEGVPIRNFDGLDGNVCCLHPAVHRERMPQWPWNEAQAA